MIMDSTFFTGLITVIGGLCSFALGHIFGRKRTEAQTEKIGEETEHLRISNLKSTIDIYRIVHEELSAQLKTLSHKCAELSNEIVILRQENISLKQELHALNLKLQK
jgi:predicted  nucleic acid-binding Zn-ribbon protein